MHSAHSLLPATVACVMALALVGCGDDAETGTGATSEGATSSTSTSGTTSSGAATSSSSTGGGGDLQVAIDFQAVVGGAAFACGTVYEHLGSGHAQGTIDDFRFYVHDVMLHQVGGGDVPVALTQDGAWQLENVALLDFEDKSGSCKSGTTGVSTTIAGTVPAGAYDGVSFKLGVPFAMNHGDLAAEPPPLDVSGMFWSWQSGHKFFRVDAKPAGAIAPFTAHLGSTGCQGSNESVTSCDRENTAQIVLTGFDPASSKIVVDAATLLEASDLSKDGCLSDPNDGDCAPLFTRLGIDIADGSMHPDTQTVFTVAP